MHVCLLEHDMTRFEAILKRGTVVVYPAKTTENNGKKEL